MSDEVARENTEGTEAVIDSEDGSMRSSRSRSSTHSLSFSGGNELSDLIAKARSEFSKTLRDDMRRFESPRVAMIDRQHKTADLNQNTIFGDKMDEDVGSAKASSLKLNLSSSPPKQGLSSPGVDRRSPMNDFKMENGVLSPRPNDLHTRSTSPRLNEINAIINGSHVSPRQDDSPTNAENDGNEGHRAILNGDTNDAQLQQKIKEQDNEIIVLKAALANVVRRLEVLESERSKQNGHMFPNGGKAVLPAAAILPSQPKSPRVFKDSIDDTKDEKEIPQIEREKSGPVKKPLTRRATDFARKPSSSSQGPQMSTAIERKKSFSRKSFDSLRRSSSISNISATNGSESTPRDEIVKFYIRGRAVSTYPPSSYVESKKCGQAPSKSLTLEWVYGYRGRDCRNNLFLLPSGEIIYNIAAVIVILDRDIGEQRHYLGHTDDVKCLALHPGKNIIASGQVAGHSKEDGKPHVRIWDSKTLETLHVIGIGYFERALCCLAFSIKDGGIMLIAIDEANEHVISLWDWEKNSRYSDNKGSNDAVLGLVFNPYNTNTFVSYGRSHIAFWTITENMKIVKKMGIFEKHGKPKFVLSAAYTANEDLLTGDSNGNLFVWGKGTNKISKAIKEAHDGGIFSICCMSDGKILTGGGKDRTVYEWNQSYRKTGMEMEVPENAGQVRTIIEGVRLDDDDLEVIVGTTKHCILDGTISSGLGYVIQGHLDELWGLATHPSKPIFVTCGSDERMFLWDADGHEVLWYKHLKEPAQSASFHPTQPILAVGTKSGRWLVVDLDTSEDIVSFQDGPEQHDAIKYSPDGKHIAVGSHDNFIYLYNVSEDGKTYKKAGKLSGHSSFVTHLDWSKDSQYLQSNSGDYEILYWDAPSCRQIASPASMKDVEWNTWTCVLGFPVIGIWPEGADGTDINACCRSSNQEYIVTGDDFGQVNFFNFPSTKPKAYCQHCVGHSSHVTCVRFMYGDNRVVSVGGKDCSVMQWKLS